MDIESLRQKKMINLEERIMCLKFSTNNDYLAAGNMSGKLALYYTADWQLMCSIEAYSADSYVVPGVLFIDWT